MINILAIGLAFVLVEPLSAAVLIGVSFSLGWLVINFVKMLK